MSHHHHGSPLGHHHGHVHGEEARLLSPTESLKEEHRVIERMLRILDAACGRLERGEEISPSVFERALDFIRTFADRCHHGKEEECLYPTLERRGIPRHGGPVGVMLAEHDEGRKFVRGLAEAVERYKAGDGKAAGAIVENARGYAAVLSQHIPKEDNILYPMADQVLRPSDEASLTESFEKIERERIGEGRHEEFMHLVEELEHELNLH